MITKKKIIFLSNVNTINTIIMRSNILIILLHMEI